MLRLLRYPQLKSFDVDKYIYRNTCIVRTYAIILQTQTHTNTLTHMLKKSFYAIASLVLIWYFMAYVGTAATTTNLFIAGLFVAYLIALVLIYIYLLLFKNE